MHELSSSESLQGFLNAEGDRLLYVHSPACVLCIEAEKTLLDCRLTIGSLLEQVAKSDITNCREFCDDQGITGTPAFVLLSGPEVVSVLNFSPTQTVLLDWLTATIVD